MLVAPTRISILIVDDQRISRFSLKAVLEQFSDMLVIGEAEDGEQAISAARALTPNIILMDIDMPGMSGIDAVQRIKADTPEQRVVIYTVSVDDNDILAALSAGADGYCLKESAPSQIAQIIRTVNEGISCLDPSIAKRILALSLAKSESPPLTNAELLGGFDFGLSEAELEILSQIELGQSSQNIADKLLINLDTLKTRMRYILVKLAVSDLTNAAVQSKIAGLT